MPKPQSYKHLVSSLKAKSADSDDDENMENDKPPADDKEDGKKSKKAKKAEKDEEDKSAEAEDDDKKDEKKDGKKASASTDADIAEHARLEERLRCATIFGSEAAAGHLETACQFAFHTDMSAATAIGIMATLPKSAPAAEATPSRGERLDKRMAAQPSVTIGADVDKSGNSASGKSLAEMDSKEKALAIINAGRAVNGEAPLPTLN